MINKHNMIDGEKFVRVWQNAATLRDVLRIMKLSYGSATSLARRFRRKGIALKKFRRGGARYQVEALKKIVNEYKTRIPQA